MLRAVKLVTSMRDPRLRRVRELASGAEARRRHGLYLVEGPAALLELLEAGERPVEVFASGRLRRDEKGPSLLSALSESAVPLREVSRGLLERVAPTRHGRGVLALLPLPEQPEDPAPVLAGAGVAVVLEGVQDPGNLGTIVRCAEAFGAAGVLALEGGADPWGPKAVRAAAGALGRLPVRRPAGGESLLDSLRRSGRSLVAAEPRGGLPPSRLPGRGPWALLLGAEGRGLSPELLEACRERVTVPLAPGVDSLNVAAAAAVLLYEMSRSGDGEERNEG